VPPPLPIGEKEIITLMALVIFKGDHAGYTGCRVEFEMEK